MEVKFEKVENGRDQYACSIPDRLYVLEKAGRLTGEYWQIIQYSEELTSRPTTFPTMQRWRQRTSMSSRTRTATAGSWTSGAAKRIR